MLISNQSLLQKRQCVFQATTQNNNSVKYIAAGNVSGSVQVCENTQCCVGYFRVTNGQPEVDVLGKKLYYSIDMKSHNTGCSDTYYVELL